ncbi:uncharacterized protein LOC106660922 [Cimex lectularius]|uniref:Uncharacterized protein n=1 Tax=Cimex lectularius TaxID=79782 RepID=A0A8I6R8Z6_CIMLE|nr:uncharacterized protein LOC106660922 [Cimex lectularius]
MDKKPLMAPQLPQIEKKRCTCAVPKPARNQLRGQVSRQLQKNTVSVQASSTDLNSRDTSSSQHTSPKNTRQVKAKVDTWRTPSYQEEQKKRRVNISEKQKKAVKGKVPDDDKYLCRINAEKMLQEVNFLLNISQCEQNHYTSKKYLRTVQRALNRSMTKGSFSKNVSTADHQNILNLVEEPVRTPSINNITSERPSTISYTSSLPTASLSEIENSKDTEGGDSFCSKNGTSDVRISRGLDSRAKTSEDEDVNSSNVRTLLSFWNQKFANRPMTVCNDIYNPQRYLSLTKNRIKSAVKLSSDGVAEEHTLKPSELKYRHKGASTIVEVLRLNSRKNNVRKTISQGVVKGNSYDMADGRMRIISTVNDDDKILNGVTISDKKMNSKEKFIEVRNSLLKKQTTFSKDSLVNRRNKWISNYLKSVDDFNKKTLKNNTIKNVFYTTHMMKKENVIPIAYPYLYVVKCLIEYTQETESWKCLYKPDILRPMPAMDPMDFSAYDYNHKYLNFPDRRKMLLSDGTGDCGVDYKMNVDKISIITGIKPNVLNTLLQITNKGDNVYNLTESDLGKLYEIGNEAASSKDSSFKDKFLYYLDNIENSFSSRIKDAYNNTVTLLSYIYQMKEMRFGEMGKRLLQREKVLYITMTVSILLLGLIMVFAASV